MEVRVGLLVLSAIVLLGGAIFVLSGVSLKPGYEVFVDFDNPGSVQAGAPVRIGGMKVGAVERVEYRGGKLDPKTGTRALVRMKLRIDREVRDTIHENALFYVTAQGVLGEQFIAIEPGWYEKPMLREGAVVHGVDPPRLDLALSLGYELLDAFERDVTVNRYADWQGLIDYCRLSAMPVGRFVLDVHGEDTALWPMNDALCAALQIINHLQDCGKDYRAIDRVYIPTRMLEKASVPVEALGEGRASPALRGVIAALATQTGELLRESAPFATAIRDVRLSAEVAIIQRLAEDLVRLLRSRDPLSEKVHHSKPRAGFLALGALARLGAKRIFA